MIDSYAMRKEIDGLFNKHHSYVFAKKNGRVNVKKTAKISVLTPFAV